MADHTRLPGAANQTNTPGADPTPGRTLYQLAIGHYMSRALALVAKLRIADQLASGPRSVEDLARATETHVPALRRVLRLVASAGLLDEDPEGRFRLTATGELLRDDVPGSMRAMIIVFAGEAMHESWKDLEYCVRTGEPAFKKYDPDADPFTAMSSDPERSATFDKAMATFAPQLAAAVTAAYDFSRWSSVVDIGGGNGTLLCGILSANPKLRGVLFDLPQVVERARSIAREPSPGARLEMAGGSFFEAVPPGHDAYLLKHVIHDWNDTEASTILKVCRKAMPAQATLLIIEGLYPARVTATPEVQAAASNDINMLVCTGGRQRSEAEFRELFAASGFELTRIVPTRAPISIIEAVPR